MPFVREFVWDHDDDFGIDGWMLRGASNYNAGFGMAVAHDTLEHFPGKWHTLEDEMLALGAIIYLRAEGGYFYYHSRSMRTPAEHLASDVFNFVVRDHHCEIKPRRTTKVTDCEIEYILPELKAECRKLWYSELDEEDRELYGKHAFDIAIKRAMDWMRVGYRMAVKRYGNLPEQWAYLFHQLEQEVDKQHKYGDYGEVLRVSVNISEASYTLTRYWPDWN